MNIKPITKKEYDITREDLCKAHSIKLNSWHNLETTLGAQEINYDMHDIMEQWNNIKV